MPQNCKIWKKFRGYPLSHHPFSGYSFRDLLIWVNSCIRQISLFKGFYKCNECETGYDKGKGNYCLDIDECYTVGCDDYDEGLELLCTNTEG